MLFNSFAFMVFFPVVTLLYFVLPQRLRNGWLLLASYFFYMQTSPQYALILAFSTLVTYFGGLMIEKAGNQSDLAKARRQKKLWVFLCCVLNLGVMVFFKYSNFVLENINIFLEKAGRPPVEQFNILLPIGISFFTFQALGYVIDVYRKDVPAQRNILKYALFVSFFPQILSGPIGRATSLMPQFDEHRRFDFQRVKNGLLLMLWGFFLKLVLADRLALLANEVFANYTDYAGFEIIMGVLFFSLQIYCDFSSYSILALGTGKVLGFELMENFNTPYLAVSMVDFWRRWHISLSSWFRDYLYFPLGGSRKGAFRKYLNTMIVFLVSGLWHGANWSFVIWGGLNGLFQVIGGLLKPGKARLAKWLHIDPEAFGNKVLRILITFGLVAFTWIFFKAPSADDAIRMIGQMFTTWNPWIFFDGSLFNLGMDQADFVVSIIGLLVLLGVSVCKYNRIDLLAGLSRQSLPFRWLVYYLAIFAVLIFGVYGGAYDASAFIYFQF